MKYFQPSSVLHFGYFLLVCSLILQWSTVHAMPSYARLYKQQYGYSPSCVACHKDGGGTPLNDYGKAFQDHGNNLSAFKGLADLDSDQDGISNAVESQAKANPGHASSTPKAKGDWLDLSSLIPKDVQSLFPEATAWKPLDAQLTPKDIKAAEALGVSLSREDDNTLYIPVAERRPIGTALIFPAQFNSKQFFLIMSTDRQLNISQVKVMTAEHLPEAERSQVLNEFSGQAVQKIELLNDNSLDDAIRRAVKRAGALIYVRLKGA